MEYLKYIPLEMNEITEYKELDKAVVPTYEEINNDFSSIDNNHFLSTLDEYGCEKLEKIMGLPSGEGLLIEDRRFLIITKANNILPYTIYNLKGKIRTILNNDGFDVNVSYGSYILTITLYKENLNKLEKVKKEIENIIPANIILNLQIKYNPYGLFKNMKFSSLKEYTYGYMKEHDFS